MIPGSANPLLLATPAAAGGLQIERSLRFNSSDSAYLSRTPAVAGDRKKWTWSMWVKRGAGLGNRQVLFGTGDSGLNNAFEVEFFGNNLRISDTGESGGSIDLQTTQVFRDCSAWGHLLVSLDTAQTTAADRANIYWNGVKITTFGTATYPGLSTTCLFNTTAAHGIGRAGSYNAQYLDGYLTNIHFIDGQALDPSSFTETDATTGQLIPKTYTGTYGTNGFNLLFADNSSNTASTLGKDSSGLGNNWTPNNFSTSTGGPTSVAAASGALPVFNTTDTYGAVKGTGTRTDTNSASIVLALPMDGTNGGTSFGDQSAVIKGSGSAKTITVTGNTNTSTTQSKFYGSGGYFDGSGDYLTGGTSSDYIFGTGDFTIECWAYFNVLNGENALVSIHNGDSNWVWKVVSGKLLFYNGSTSNIGTSTITAGSWYHFAVTRQSSSLKLWVNGINETTATVSIDYTINNTLYLGAQQNNLAATYLNGYLQDVRIYKGVAKYTGNFNPPSSTANPTIAAGNDSLVDSPTNYGTDTYVGGEVRGNYATLNPLFVNAIAATLSNGNLDYTVSSGSYAARFASIGMSSGKWYAEFLFTVVSGAQLVGIANNPPSSITFVGDSASGYSYAQGGQKYTNGGAVAYGASYTNGDIIGIAFDADAGTLVFYKNGSSQGTAFSSIAAGSYFFGISGTSGTTGSWNFGQRAFAYQTPGTNRPAATFLALCTQNLPAPLVTKSNTVMDVALYTGTGSAQSITGLAFSPDFVWIKPRSAATQHNLYDVVRGATKELYSDYTSAEGTAVQGLTSFNSDGFSLGSLSYVNGSSTTFVGWAWDAGTSTVSNTAGSITSQVRANATAGFSVVTYTAPSSGAFTVGHGLGVSPSFYITKSRSNAYAWGTYHASIGNTGRLDLNTTNAVTTSQNAAWNNTSPTSTVFSVGSDWAGSGITYVAYAFAPVVGYSNAFSYSGNGSSDGPMVYLGFRPRLILLKVTNTTGPWYLFDTARNTYNVMNNRLEANSSSAEASDRNVIDALSNGFKLRDVDAVWNQSANTYVGFAWAEMPFNYSRAR